MDLAKELEDIKELERVMLGESPDGAEDTPDGLAGNADTSVKEDQVLDPSADAEVIPSHTEDHLETPTDTNDTVDEHKQRPKYKELYEQLQKRFNNYKGSNDTALFTTRKEVNSLQAERKRLTEKVDGLNLIIAELSEGKDIFKDVITPDEAEILGDEAVTSMKKLVASASDNQVKPLQKEINDLKERLRQKESDDLETNQQEVIGSFYTKLSNAVSNLEQVNTDPGFMEYLNGVDELSGMTRKYLFSQAEINLDVGRVAGFFNDYTSSQVVEVVKPGVNTILEESITPVGTHDSAAPIQDDNKNKPISIKEIDDFWNKANRGFYKGRESEFQTLKAKYDQAFGEGNIIP